MDSALSPARLGSGIHPLSSPYERSSRGAVEDPKEHPPKAAPDHPTQAHPLPRAPWGIATRHCQLAGSRGPGAPARGAGAACGAGRRFSRQAVWKRLRLQPVPLPGELRRALPASAQLSGGWGQPRHKASAGRTKWFLSQGTKPDADTGRSISWLLSRGTTGRTRLPRRRRGRRWGITRKSWGL